MRTCVIFNPAARGSKARHFRHNLGDMAGESAFKATTAAGDARRLAAEAVRDGFELVVAAGGDGTVHEVLNGIGDADAYEKICFGILPLGTMNVFARELKIPMKLESAWEILRQGKENQIDLPVAEFSENGIRKKNYFAQLAGAGLDARAIELVNWRHKKKIGPLAYVIAGLKALREKKPKITVSADGKIFEGELILIGNGKFYGGPFEIFPQADLRDGLLDICIFPQAGFSTMFKCAPNFLLHRRLSEKSVQRVRAANFELSGESCFELEGELIGKLPATFSIAPKKLRVVAPIYSD